MLMLLPKVLQVNKSQVTTLFQVLGGGHVNNTERDLNEQEEMLKNLLQSFDRNGAKIKIKPHACNLFLTAFTLHFFYMCSSEL